MEMYKHQELLLETLTDNDTYGVYWEQRTGKTLPVLLHTLNLMVQGKAESALIIAPKSALGAWKRDMRSLKGVYAKLTEKIDLVHYEIVWRRPKYDRPYDVVIIDECHRIAHRTSKQSKFCRSYTSRSKYRYILSGTPMGQGRLEDLYAQMEFLEEGFFGPYREFEARYLITKTLAGTFVKFVVGYRNKEELLEKVGRKVSSLRLKDVSDMPEDLPDNIIDVDKPNQMINRGVKDMYVKQYDIIIQNPAVQMMKYRQVASGFIIDEKGVTHDVTTNKEQLFGEVLDSILPEKVVVFAEFKHSIDVIEKHLTKKGLRFVTLNGNQKDKEIWTQFQENDDITVIVCNYASANAGIDLYKSHHIIFYQPSLSTLMTEQARSRIKKTDKSQACAYHWLISVSSIEEKIYDQLIKKQDFTLDNMKAWKVR